MTDDAIYTAISLGFDAEAFCSSPLGKHVLALAAEARDNALAELCNVDPTDAKAIMRLQGEVWRAESFEEWLRSAYSQAIALEQELRANT